MKYSNFLDENKLILLLSGALIGLIVFTWHTAQDKNVYAPTAITSLEVSKILAKNIIVPSFDAKAALVVDSNFRETYYAKNYKEKRAIASITKLFSAVVILENYNLTDEVLVSGDSISKANSVPGVRIDLYQNDKIRVFDLLSALLVDSSNEAAYALAEAWPKGGLTPEEKTMLFVVEMNSLASRVGLEDTSFSDPAGLDDKGGNYSTAFDLAKFIIWMQKYPMLKEMSIQPFYNFFSIKGISYRFQNTNKLLEEAGNILLSKTGFTEGAGQSIVMEIKNDNHDYILILLGAPDRLDNAKEIMFKMKDLKVSQ